MTGDRKIIAVGGFCRAPAQFKGGFLKDKKKKGFLNFYDWIYKRDKKEEADDDRDAPRDFLFFFKLLGRNLSRIFSLNIYFILGNIALWMVFLILGGVIGPSTTAPTSEFYGPLYGAALMAQGSPLVNTYLSVHSMVTEVTVLTPVTITLVVIFLIALFLTFGPVMTGITYNMRNIVRGEPLFMWSDFKYAIKRNLRQSIILGVMDLVIMFALVYGLVFYYINLHSTLFGVFFYLTIFITILYLFMRKYLYLMLVTFKLSIPKLFKNALIFAVLGFGRNFVSSLGILVVLIVNYTLLILFLPLGAALALILTAGMILFIDCYAAWPKIKSLMIDPYYGKTATADAAAGNSIGSATDDSGEGDYLDAADDSEEDDSLDTTDDSE